MKLPSILTPSGRRAWAFAAVFGGCGVMTAFAAVAVYLVKGHAAYSFWLGLAAHGQIALGLGVFGAQFVKRTIRAGKDGIEIADHSVTAEAKVEVKDA